MKTWTEIVAKPNADDKDTIHSSSMSKLMSLAVVLCDQARLQSRPDATCMSVSAHVFTV